MSDDFDNEPSYSPFWPLLIFLVGFALSLTYQLYVVNAQRVLFSQQFQTLLPVVNQAQGAKAKLYAVAEDLLKTSAKNQYAAQIVKESNIQIRPNGAGAAPAAAPATTASPSPAPAK